MQHYSLGIRAGDNFPALFFLDPEYQNGQLTVRWYACIAPVAEGQDVLIPIENHNIYQI